MESIYGKNKTLKIGKAGQGDYKSSTIDNLNVEGGKKSKMGFQENGKGLIKSSQKLKGSSVNMNQADPDDEASRLVVSRAQLRKQFMKEREKSFRTDTTLNYKFPYFRIIFKTLVISVLFTLLVLASFMYI